MGARDFGGFRWAQTANYGVLPNPALPNTFLAQAYDLPDPWYIRPMCDAWHCCSVWPFAPKEFSLTSKGFALLTACNASTAPHGGPSVCASFCESRAATPAGYLGNLHSRLKRPVGQRLAKAAFAQVYGGTSAFTGPTIAGCTLHRPGHRENPFPWPFHASRAANQTLAVRFNRTLMRDETLVWRTAAPPAFEVLVDPTNFCVQPMQRCKSSTPSPPTSSVQLHPAPSTTAAANASSESSRLAQRLQRCSEHEREWWCPKALRVTAAHGYRPTEVAHAGGLLDFGYVIGGARAAKPARGDVFEDGWREVDILAIDQASSAVTLDLSPLAGAAVHAVRYAWGVSGSGAHSGEKLCCRDAGALLGVSKPCRPASCALMASGGLPVNPFMARIVDGRCECLAPQECNG
jgi:hypothetical protein